MTFNWLKYWVIFDENTRKDRVRRRPADEKLRRFDRVDGLPDNLRRDVGLPERDGRPPPGAPFPWKTPWHF